MITKSLLSLSFVGLVIYGVCTYAYIDKAQTELQHALEKVLMESPACVNTDRGLILSTCASDEQISSLRQETKQQLQHVYGACPLPIYIAIAPLVAYLFLYLRRRKDLKNKN